MSASAPYISNMWQVASDTMLPCAPYISSMCQPVQAELPEDTPGEEIVKKDTEVKISDVKSIKVDLVYPACDLVKTENKLRGSVESIPKEFSTFKPESPDVLRAAKILENSKKCLSNSDEQIHVNDSDAEEKVIKSLEEEKKEQEKLGAISKR